MHSCVQAPPATAAVRLPAADDVEVYVGAGCFWHVQHEMTVAEQALLGRDGKSFTAGLARIRSGQFCLQMLTCWLDDVRVSVCACVRICDRLLASWPCGVRACVQCVCVHAVYVCECVCMWECA